MPKQYEKGYFSSTDLAIRHGIPEPDREAFEKALKRWRKGKLDGYIEQDTQSVRQPKFLYQESAVREIIEKYVPPAA